MNVDIVHLNLMGVRESLGLLHEQKEKGRHSEDREFYTAYDLLVSNSVMYLIMRSILG